jgi:hypothetical protein
LAADKIIKLVMLSPAVSGKTILTLKSEYDLGTNKEEVTRLTIIVHLFLFQLFAILEGSMQQCYSQSVVLWSSPMTLSPKEFFLAQCTTVEEDPSSGPG